MMWLRHLIRWIFATAGLAIGWASLASCAVPSHRLPARQILSSWVVGMPDAKVLDDLKKLNVRGSGSAGSKLLFQDQAFCSVDASRLAQISDFSTPSLDLRNPWLEITFDHQVLASVSLTFNSTDAEMTQLKQLILPQVKGFKVIRPDTLWLSPSGDRFVYFGDFDHGWRFRSALMSVSKSGPVQK